MSVRSPSLVQLAAPAAAQLAPSNFDSATVPVATPSNAQGQVRVPETRSALARTKIWVKRLLGYSGSRRAQRDRREVVSLVLHMIYSGVQIIVILTLTILAAITTSPVPVPHKRPPEAQSEFSACSLLGAWNLIWLGRTVVRCYLEIWLFRFKRARRAARQRVPTAGLPPLAFQQQQGDPQGEGAANIAAERAELAPGLCPLTWTSIHCTLYKVDPLFAIIWFWSTVLIIWTHGSRCHVAAKDISALTVTVLIMTAFQSMYTSLIPALRIMQARRQAERPVVAKMSKKDVSRIPLVLYIPPPPGHPPDPISPLSLPRSMTHPVLSLRPSPSKRRRFIPFRPSLQRSASSEPADLEQGKGGETMIPVDEEVDEWERSWERGAYPFVRLPENRATCLICLTDFEAPRRVSECIRRPVSEAGLEMQLLSSATPDTGPVEELPVESPMDVDVHTIHMADAGSSDAPQPLRLLSCGHAYHKDCVDLWLTQKSGRCPYCSANVEVPLAPGRRISIWSRGTV